MHSAVQRGGRLGVSPDLEFQRAASNLGSATNMLGTGGKGANPLQVYLQNERTALDGP